MLKIYFLVLDVDMEIFVRMNSIDCSGQVEAIFCIITIYFLKSIFQTLLKAIGVNWDWYSFKIALYTEKMGIYF